MLKSIAWVEAPPKNLASSSAVTVPSLSASKSRKAFLTETQLAEILSLTSFSISLSLLAKSLFLFREIEEALSFIWLSVKVEGLW